MSSDQNERAVAFLRGLASGDADRTTRYVDTGRFVQHDPDRMDGVAGLGGRAATSSGDSRLEVVRLLEDDAFVVAHGREGAADDGQVFFAVFRFEDGLIVERWRFTTPAAPLNENGQTQTDGKTEADAGHDTAKSKAVVRDYYQAVHIVGG